MVAGPHSGDLVVRKRVIASVTASVRYEVMVLDHPSQLSEPTYERALHLAEGVARTAGVDVWYTEDGTLFRAIVNRRQQEATS
jgi:hypothetical protein